MAAIVIADASPLIALARVNGLGWLQQLFSEVVICGVVLSEVLTGCYPETEVRIQQALAAGWLRVVAVDRAEPLLPDLDEGEAASIRLALSCEEPVLLLIASAREVFAVLHASGFRIAPAVIQAVLDRSGE